MIPGLISHIVFQGFVWFYSGCAFLNRNCTFHTLAYLLWRIYKRASIQPVLLLLERSKTQFAFACQYIRCKRITPNLSINMDNMLVHRIGLFRSYKNQMHFGVCWLCLVTIFSLVSGNEVYVPISSKQAGAVSLNCTNGVYRRHLETAIRCLKQSGCPGFWHNPNPSSALCVCPQDRWEYFAPPLQAGVYLWITTQLSKGLVVTLK